MNYAALVLSGLVGLMHIYILVLEMFLWQTKKVRRIFGTTEEQAASSAVLAANQGLYNGFLAAGLLWGVAFGNVAFLYFFNACVCIAGLYGGWSTGKPRILIIQSVPTAAALVCTYLAYGIV